MSTTIAKRIDANSLNLKEQVVSINRVTKVVKGGKNMSFSALVVVGDPGARIVGFGTGKAKEVPAAIKKGIEAAKKNLRRVHVLATTIQHPVVGVFGAGRVLVEQPGSIARLTARISPIPFSPYKPRSSRCFSSLRPTPCTASGAPPMATTPLAISVIAS